MSRSVYAVATTDTKGQELAFLAERLRAAGVPVATHAMRNPEFDLLSNRPGKGSQGIEVKGRTGIGYVELTENGWPKAFNQRGRYWLFVVYD